MKGLRALINTRKAQRDGIIPPGDSPPKETHLPSNSSIEEELKTVKQQHLITVERRKRAHPEPSSSSAKRPATDALAQATRILFENRQPLKLFGETNHDIVARAQHFRSVVRGKVYASIPDIDTTTQPNELLLSFIRTCFAIWGEKLIKKHEDARIYNASQRAMTPLLQALQNDTLSSDIRDKLHASAVHCVRGEYKDAHAAYISLAIGDAPWPMGVTMVGIHERVGRSRIAASEITHILDDEATCQFVQVFKRLMSLCQAWYPQQDMSQMVLLSASSAAPA